MAPRQARFSRQREATAKGTTPTRLAPLLIQYHIFKNAGTSFEWALQQAFRDRFRQYDSASPGGVIFARGVGASRATGAKPGRNRSLSAGPQSEAEIMARLVRDLGAKLTGELLRRNELDMRLHQIADALLTRCFAERSIAIRLRDAYGKVEEEYDLPADCESGEQNLPVASNGD